MVNNITSRRHLTFSEEEVPAEQRGHNQSLHISVKCGDYMITRVLIDNGSSLNILPKATLEKLSSISSQLRVNPIVVRAFDGSRREVMGEITLPTYIGPTVFDVTLQVMEIHPAYSCLLGRPWIHAVGAIASSLHQRCDEQERVANQHALTLRVHRRGRGGHRTPFPVAQDRRHCNLHSRKPYTYYSRRHGALGHDQGRVPVRKRTGPPFEWYTSLNHYTRKCGESRTWLFEGQPGQECGPISQGTNSRTILRLGKHHNDKGWANRPIGLGLCH
ncbi:hypothetical protein CR513_12765, partial [Mucuna pruriens]